MGSREKQERQRTRSERVKLYTWSCQYCGQLFKTTSYGQRYCNATHKKYAYRERKQIVHALTVDKNSP